MNAPDTPALGPADFPARAYVLNVEGGRGDHFMLVDGPLTEHDMMALQDAVEEGRDVLIAARTPELLAPAELYARRLAAAVSSMPARH